MEELNTYRRWVIGADERFASDAEAHEYITMAKRGDKNAMEKIIRSNMNMLHKYANAYSRSGSCHDDLISEGMIAIIKAVHSFDAKNCSVGTMLITAVRTAMRRYCGLDKNVRIAVNANEKKSKLHAVMERLKAEGKEVTVQLIAKESNFSINQVYRLIGIELGVVSMNSKAEGDEGEGDEFGDSIADTQLNPYEQIQKDDDFSFLMKSVGELDDIEKNVIELRYGLFGNEVKTLTEVAEIIGKSAERVRQLESQAIRKIKSKLK